MRAQREGQPSARSLSPPGLRDLRFKKLGIDVRRSRRHPTLIDFIENRGVKVVYDVGANVGQFGIGLRQRGYDGKIFSFEPVKSAFDALKSVAATDKSWNVLRCAIGSETGEVWVNVSVKRNRGADHDGSDLGDVNRAKIRAFPNTKDVEKKQKANDN